MKLSILKTGEIGLIKNVKGEGAFRKRILEMGFIRGKEVKVILNAPFKDPVYYRVMGYNVSLRREDAELIEVEKINPVDSRDFLPGEGESSLPTSGSVVPDLSLDENIIPDPRCNLHLEEGDTCVNDEHRDFVSGNRSNQKKSDRKTIRVALVGNPNSGKTSIFNLASGKNEKVGNYSGVTVDAHTAHLYFEDYYLELIDLPGSYSLSPYSPEELYIRNYLIASKTRPDVVIDVLDSTNLERNLYLSVQLKELEIPMVFALNMFDEFRKSQAKLDIPKLEALFNTRFVPTVGRSAEGIRDLLLAVVECFENTRKNEGEEREIKIAYGTVLEPRIQELSEKIQTVLEPADNIPPRYLAVRLMEGDKQVEKYIATQKKGDFVLSARSYLLSQVQKLLGTVSPETVITDQRYGFISGALRETYKQKKNSKRTLTDKIDAIVLHRYGGFPLFLFFLYLMFQCTFTFGAYPQEWIEMCVDWLGSGVARILPPGAFTDLLVDGIIAGVGGVIVFLPQILILYLFISLMEDTGYMARATFLMDKLMHGMGLHGKSFIPLIMGFGCNVPSIMATRTIESKQSRLITILINPLMSCSARLPVYLLLAGAFFPRHAGVVLFSIYTLGIVLAVGLAWLFRKALFKKEDLPFVMELPPYRMPTTKSVFIHMWDRGKLFLTKMGTVILVASIAIWALGYFPREAIFTETEQKIARLQSDPTLSEQEIVEKSHSFRLEANQEQQRNSYLGKIGRAIEPVMAPLGFDWKMSIAIASGLPAKEVVVSTLGVIYTGDADDSEEATMRLTEKLRTATTDDGNPSFTPLLAVTFMVFILIYFPCIATIAAIARETGSWKWALFVILYTCVLAWSVAFIVYRVGLLLGYS